MSDRKQSLLDGKKGTSLENSIGPAPFPLERERPIAEGAYLRWLARGGAHEFNAPEEIDF